MYMHGNYIMLAEVPGVAREISNNKNKTFFSRSHPQDIHGVTLKISANYYLAQPLHRL